MPFRFGGGSLLRLDEAHHDLQEVLRRAITRTSVDFSILEVCRALERQKEMKRIGASRTMKSRHLPGKDGLAFAADLGAYIGGAIRWEFALYIKIAEAMREAAIALNIPIVWGAVWDQRLNSITEDLGFAVRLYRGRYGALHHRTPLIDGPHFELYRRKYPA